jgi:hypothetical protein
MVLFSVIYAGVAVFFLKEWSLGTSGLILANAVNMLLRITWAWVWTVGYARDQFNRAKNTSAKKSKQQDILLPRTSILPKIGPLVVFALSYGALLYLRPLLNPTQLFCVGIPIGLCCCASVLIAERDMTQQLWQLFRGRQKQA